MEKYTVVYVFYVLHVQYPQIYAQISSLYLPSLKPSYTPEHKSSLQARTASSADAQYQNSGGSPLGLSLTPQLSDMGGVVTSGHGSLIN